MGTVGTVLGHYLRQGKAPFAFSLVAGPCSHTLLDMFAFTSAVRTPRLVSSAPTAARKGSFSCNPLQPRDKRLSAACTKKFGAARLQDQ